MGKWVLLVIGATGLAVAGLLVFSNGGEDPIEYRFAKVERGTITKTVSASGELNAVTTVQVGSQISGRVEELLADFNSEVRAGEVIARIDPESLKAKVRQAEADLAVTKAMVLTNKAAVARAGADLANARSLLTMARAESTRASVTATDAELDYRRKEELHKRGAVAVSQFDKSRAAYETAKAQVIAAQARGEAEESAIQSRLAMVEMARAEVAQALAQVQKSEAGLQVARVDLEKTLIRSPVDGVVIARNVDVGQTVAASLQAPILFKIAQDLRRMQVETNIDETDIGQVRTGQNARFSVDSFSGREFSGIVSQVRKAPQTVQNVVTYTVVVSADNPDLRLLPGMTANVRILVGERADVLRVPNAALRFRPSGAARPQPIARAASGGGAARAAARLERLTERLALSAEQKEQIGEIMKAARQHIRALRRGGAQEPELRAVIEEQRRRQGIKVVALLEPDQRLKFEQLRARRAAAPVTRGQVWVVKDGVAKALDVVIGINDDSFSEIVRGELSAGQEIVVGIRRVAAAQENRRFLRFGL